MNTLGQTIRQARLHKGWTQAKVSRLSGVDIARISKIENDYSPVFLSEQSWIDLGHALDINPDYMLLANGRIPDKYRDVVAANADKVLALFNSLEALLQTLEETANERRTGHD
jgi:transcriptional regulator with XRE-family HTH domain